MKENWIGFEIIFEGRRKIRSTNVMSSVHVPTIDKAELEERKTSERYRNEFEEDL
jgi:hypothetical protein